MIIPTDDDPLFVFLWNAVAQAYLFRSRNPEIREDDFRRQWALVVCGFDEPEAKHEAASIGAFEESEPPSEILVLADKGAVEGSQWRENMEHDPFPGLSLGDDAYLEYQKKRQAIADFLATSVTDETYYCKSDLKPLLEEIREGMLEAEFEGFQHPAIAASALSGDPPTPTKVLRSSIELANIEAEES